MQLKKFRLKGEEAGTVTVKESIAGAVANGQMVKDYIVALRANVRQWSANTKGRSEVKCTTKKPHRQKGTGGARQGTLVAPQYRGGGIVFGPKPKFDQHVRINRKERQAAIRTLLRQKIEGERVIVIENDAFHDALQSSPKTKVVAEFVKNRNLQGRKVLFIGEGHSETIDGEFSISIKSQRHDNFKKSLRNLPGCAFTIAPNINGYDLIASYALVFTEKAFEQLVEMVG
jgi:large subunit ribosomal protein L4